MLEVIIDKAAGGETGWIATYKSVDMGTERLIIVKDSDGNIIGQRDPFYPAGIPVDKKQQDRRIRKVIRDIVLDYQQRQTEKSPTAARKIEAEKKIRQLPIEEKTKKAWQMTKDEYLEYIYGGKPETRGVISKEVYGTRTDVDIDSQAHKISVKRALSEGKSVSLKVLKDYPDLQEQTTEARKTQAESFINTSEQAAPSPKYTVDEWIAEQRKRQKG